MNLTMYDTAASSEHEALVRIITGMREAGWSATTHYDGEEMHGVPLDLPAGVLADQLMETGAAGLKWCKHEHTGTMFFVFGNDPWDVMNDCTTGREFMIDLMQVEYEINLEGE